MEKASLLQALWDCLENKEKVISPSPIRFEGTFVSSGFIPFFDLIYISFVNNSPNSS